MSRMRWLGGIDRGLIDYREGKRTPTIENLIKIAAARNVTVGWLAAGEGEQRTAKTKTDLKSTNIEPGSGEEKITGHNIHLRQILDWMNAEFGEDDEEALFFYEEMKDAFEDFAEFIEEKKRAGGSGVAARMHDEKKKTA